MESRRFCTRFLGIAIVFLAVSWTALAAPGLYVVELEGQPAIRRAVEETRQARGARQALAGRGWAKHAAAVEGEQLERERRVEERGGKVLGAARLAANALFVEIDDEQAASLGEIAGVRRVRPAREYRMTMDAAIPLHRIREAWELAGGENRAGAGVKIAIIDSGIEASHPAFRTTDMEAPEGFPRTTSELDSSLVTGKIIVARSYVNLLRNFDPDRSARDHVGHGTAAAMIAAGVVHEGPMGWVSGVAPRAWLGSYKVFGTPGFNSTTTDAALLQAIDEALADGMDILNLSLGSDIALRLEEDTLAQALENAAEAGALLVVAAGNNGPGWTTISSPATAPSALSVGASTNSRTFGFGIQFEGKETLLGAPGNGPPPAEGVSGAVADAAALDENGLACGKLPEGSLAGKIALILRGECTFELKLNNAKNAGAVAALVQAREESPEPITMAVGSADLPAMMISYANGQKVREWLAGGEPLLAVMSFRYSRVEQRAGLLADFSAHGPSVDLAIKPELTATGTDMWIATQTLNPDGAMWSETGYTLVDGTSFSAPLAAGAAALVKAARPGLDARAVRSALVNTAARISDEASAWIQKSGAGLLDAEAAVRSQLAASSAALSFGASAPGEGVDAQTLTVKQTGDGPETYFVRVEHRRGPAVPAVSAEMVELAPGGEAEIRVDWPEPLTGTGTYEGYVVLEGASSGLTLRVPYWRAVTPGEPASVTVLRETASARRGASVRDAFLFRLVDESGVPVHVGEVAIEELDGGSVLSVTDYDELSPGLYGVSVRLGLAAGANRFRIRAGAAEYVFTITGV
jgi:minor extracellular serine protease Vpr